VDLMAGKIRKLPEKTQAVLQMAACVGHQFNLRLLSIVQEIPLNQVGEELWDALQAGLLIPQDRSYRLQCKQEDVILWNRMYTRPC